MTRGRLVRGGAWLAAVFGIASPAAAAGAPPCLASVALDPERAVTGQQVLYRVRVLSREAVTSVEWIEPPSFPGFRAERLPPRPQPDREVRGGVSYRVREESQALFAERPGSHRLRGTRLRCRVPGEAEAGFDVALPDATLVVVAPPEPGRPPGFGGLVGPLAIRTVVEPRAIPLGRSVRLRVVLQGSGNLWDAPDPLRLASEDAEVFRQRPEARLERGARLFVRMRFDYDLVPRSVGTLLVPAIRLPYFDPDAQRYAVAAAPAVEVTVEPPATAPAGAGGPPARASATPSDADSPRVESGPWLPIGLLLAAGGAAAVALVLRRRTRRAGDLALAAAASARDRGDREAEAAALARALREGLAELVPAARSAAAEEIVERVSAPVAARAARLLAAVERSRFDPGATPPDRAEVERALGELRRRRGRGRVRSLRAWLARH